MQSLVLTHRQLFGGYPGRTLYSHLITGAAQDTAQIIPPKTMNTQNILKKYLEKTSQKNIRKHGKFHRPFTPLVWDPVLFAMVSCLRRPVADARQLRLAQGMLQARKAAMIQHSLQLGFVPWEPTPDPTPTKDIFSAVPWLPSIP